MAPPAARLARAAPGYAHLCAGNSPDSSTHKDRVWISAQSLKAIYHVLQDHAIMFHHEVPSVCIPHPSCWPCLANDTSCSRALGRTHLLRKVFVLREPEILP